MGKALVCTPGFAATSLIQNSPCVGRTLSCITACVAQSSEDGAMPLLTCIAGPDVASGDLYLPSLSGELKGPPRKLARPSADKEVEDKASQKMLWEESEK